jgi:hypothetical protein
MQIELKEEPTAYQGTSNGNGTSPCVQLNMDAKGQRARNRQYIQIFLSHKLKDRSAAKAISEVLQANSAGKIRVFIAEDITKGVVYQKEIEQQLYDSDWFVLLFTGVEDEDWSWCHHEAGIFCGMTYPDDKRVIVLYPPNVDLPDPLAKYEAVKCETTADGESEDVERFLQDLFGKEPYPGFAAVNPYFAFRAASTRQEAAGKIVKSVGRLVVDSIISENVMVLEVPDVKVLDATGFPDDTRIKRGSGAMQLFGLGRSGFSWRQFRDRLETNLRQDLDETFWPAVYAACAKSLSSCRVVPTYAVFRSPADGHHYLPVINRVDITGDNSATFSISFVQTAAGTQSSVREKSVARIFTALNLSHRFRWEIIDPYKEAGRLQDFVDHRARAGGLATVWDAIKLLEIESRNRGVNDPEALPSDFGPAARVRVSAMFDQWQPMRRRLEEAAHAGDVTGFAAVLSELDPLNVEFISLAAKRLGELVRADADRPDP